ncbi:hypothetical protein [Trichocoleus sp. FACHB-262]|uniref:hypothetical protein n=1 Tax=Trichocoleus sp. FACHB-262 TaxID=2692869 RepID=UPI00168968C8|nr:hypothetical protein [Trichocoleus sp. FACHB-262]MBD2123532.1 hypothetical protein [Trichocoleus sp. FACHB-262]
MAIAPDSATDFSLPPGDVPLGIQKPLGLLMGIGQGWLQPKFLTPLGTRSLTVLDPAIFRSAQEPISDWRSPFEDSPFFDPPESSSTEAASPSPTPATVQTIPNSQPSSSESAIAPMSDEEPLTPLSSDGVAVPPPAGQTPAIAPLSDEVAPTPERPEDVLDSPAANQEFVPQTPVAQAEKPSVDHPIAASMQLQAKALPTESTAESRELNPYSLETPSSNFPEEIETPAFDNLESSKITESPTQLPKESAQPASNPASFTTPLERTELPEAEPDLAIAQPNDDGLTALPSSTIEPLPLPIDRQVEVNQQAKLAIARSAIDLPHSLHKTEPPASPIASESLSIETAAEAGIELLDFPKSPAQTDLSSPTATARSEAAIALPTSNLSAEAGSPPTTSSTEPAIARSANLEAGSALPSPEPVNQQFTPIATTGTENSSQVFEELGDQPSQPSSLVQRAELTPELPGSNDSAALSLEQPLEDAQLNQITYPLSEQSSDQLPLQASVASEPSINLENLEALALSEPQTSAQSTNTESLPQSSQTELYPQTFDQFAATIPEPNAQLSESSQSSAETTPIQTALNVEPTSAEQLQETNQAIDAPEVVPVQLQTISDREVLPVQLQSAEQISAPDPIEQQAEAIATEDPSSKTQQNAEPTILSQEVATPASSDFQAYDRQPEEIEQPLIQAKFQADSADSLLAPVETNNSVPVQPLAELTPEILQPKRESVQDTQATPQEAELSQSVDHEAGAAEAAPIAATESNSEENSTELPELPTVLQPLSVWEPLTQTTQMSLIDTTAIAPLSSPVQPVQSAVVPSIQAKGGDRSSASTSPREQSQNKAISRENAGPTDWSNIAELFQTSAESRSETQAPEITSSNGYTDLNLYPESQSVVEEIVQRQPIQADALSEISDSSTSNGSAQTDPDAASQVDKSSSSPEQLERLAQEIYRLVRQRLALERERGGHPYLGRLL